MNVRLRQYVPYPSKDTIYHIILIFIAYNFNVNSIVKIAHEIQVNMRKKPTYCRNITHIV